jgi:hypothetical protein
MRPALLLLALAPLWAGSRTTISLDGTWQIADAPGAYTHTAPVPGLAHSATPAFANVDEFESRQLIQNRVKRGLAPKESLVDTAGVSKQDRTYFWYRRTFDLAATAPVAILRINKAQFGAAVWINGEKVGEHLPCFTAAIFDVSRIVRTGRNEIVVRVGAHPGVLPPTVSGGTDFEKNRWTPGIYDSVSLALSGPVHIDTVQVAPKIDPRGIVVQTKVRNYGNAAATFDLRQRVTTWTTTDRLTLAPGEERTVVQALELPTAKLWSPEEPNLYTLETDTGADTLTTRFGVREFRFDTATRRAYLNGRPYFLRGSNITLHRFFEDPKSGTLPWDEKWVRKLLVDIPKEMHWNAFRFCIGPAPDRWLDIADEAGLLIQNEYFVWTGRNWHGPGSQVHFDAPQMIAEYKEWLRDNWNHPSVAIWDASNETYDPMFADKIIPAVRDLDLSNRAWENSYNGPAGADDPVEDHPYEFSGMAGGGPDFSMTTLERPLGKAPGVATGHAMILNEYGWTWLNRDGSPTELTKNLYPRLLGPNATADDRLKLNAYLLAGITEYWRAYRQYAGVLHFVYLTSSDPGGYTADHFRDVEKLELDPYFKDYLSNAFNPLGVFLSFFQPTLTAGSRPAFTVMLVNDDSRETRGTLSVAIVSASGRTEAQIAIPFAVNGNGQETYSISLPVPDLPGDYTLKATAGQTQSRRNVQIVRR